MAIVEQKDIESIEYFPGRKSINVLWKNKIVRDGVVIHEENQRRAMPINENGELGELDEAILGSKLSDILGNVGKDAIIERDFQKQEKERLEVDLNNEKASKSVALSRVIELEQIELANKNEIAELKTQLDSTLTLLDSTTIDRDNKVEIIKQKDSSISNLNELVEQLRSEIEQLTQERENLSLNVSSGQSEIEHLKQEKNSLISDLDFANAEIEKLKQEKQITNVEEVKDDKLK